MVKEHTVYNFDYFKFLENHFMAQNMYFIREFIYALEKNLFSAIAEERVLLMSMI